MGLLASDSALWRGVRVGKAGLVRSPGLPKLLKLSPTAGLQLTRTPENRRRSHTSGRAPPNPPISRLAQPQVPTAHANTRLCAHAAATSRASIHRSRVTENDWRCPLTRRNFTIKPARLSRLPLSYSVCMVVSLSALVVLNSNALLPPARDPAPKIQPDADLCPAPHSTVRWYRAYGRVLMRRHSDRRLCAGPSRSATRSRLPAGRWHRP